MLSRVSRSTVQRSRTKGDSFSDTDSDPVAKRGRSKLEFVAKIGIALEEADEAEFWLCHLRDAAIMTNKETDNLQEEAGELVAILTTAQRNARGR